MTTMAHDLRLARLAATLACAALLALAVPAGAAPPPALTLEQGMQAIDAAPAGSIPWQLLMQAKTVQKANKKFGPEFNAEIKELNNRQVKLYGFMLPLDQSRLQKRFLLTAFSPHCAFCMPGGPESIVEVIADKPVEFSYEPVLIAGKMEVLENDVVYYRLTGATAAKD
jgi:uncharacterized protein